MLFSILVPLALGAPAEANAAPAPEALLSTPARTFGAPLPYAPLAPSAAPQVENAEGTESDPAWAGSLTIGANYSSGNTETQSVAADAEATLERGRDTFSIGAYWNYAEYTDFTEAGAPTKLSARNWGANGQYDYFLNEARSTYAYASASFQGDSLAELDLRTIYGVGVGHQFLDEDDKAFSGEIGLSQVDEDFEDSASDTENLTVRLAYDLFWQVADTTAFRQKAQAFPSVEDSDDFYGRLETSLTMNVTESMIAKLTHVLDFDNTPAVFSDAGDIRAGQRAERVDQRFILSVGWTF